MSSKMSYNNDLLRLKNRGQIFEQLVKNDVIYRRELAEKCGLTKMTISYIVNEFLEKGIVAETVKSDEKKPGRKSTYLRLVPDAKKIIGLMIKRDCISVALCDFRLNVIESDSIQFVACDYEHLLEYIFQLIDKMIKGNDILGIGVGSIGPVDTEKGIILNPPNFHGIKDVQIEQILKKHYGVPVYLDYHYNCGARVEKYFGLAKNCRNFIFLSVKGLGLSSVVDGRILTRMTGISSEFGHMTVDYNGPECFCGRRGCLGGYLNYSTEESTWESVRILCGVLAGVCDILIPEALIIRDECSRLKKEHIDWMESELNKKIIARNYRKIDVLLSERSHEPEVVSCATNILGRVFSGEIEI